MKRIILVPLVFTMIFLLCGCHTIKYREADFLGKSSQEIVSNHGSFDCVGKPADEDGVYRNTACGYTVKEARAGFLGTDPEVLFFISFDENGIADACYEGCRPGG